MTRTQGFCSVNDGSKTGNQLAKAIEAKFGKPSLAAEIENAERLAMEE